MERRGGVRRRGVAPADDQWVAGPELGIGQERRAAAGVAVRMDQVNGVVAGIVAVREPGGIAHGGFDAGGQGHRA